MSLTIRPHHAPRFEETTVKIRWWAGSLRHWRRSGFRAFRASRLRILLAGDKPALERIMAGDW